ncbi:MAG TPA: winged helix-turn-helix domain-containing protein [Candidatus Acidoferrales bacterium]|nr:winged helix-turn-helix domain-containing protein [Candidatus Acidoferrales bacterium]
MHPERAHRELRHARAVYEKGRLRIDFDAYEVCVDGRAVHLTRREFLLLRFFVQWTNRVFDRTQIVEHLWPEERIDPRTVDVHICRLRRCIEREPAHPELLITVRGVGWRFDDRSLTSERPHHPGQGAASTKHRRAQSHR